MLAYVIAALAPLWHEPSPNDYALFGLPLAPAYSGGTESLVRQRWQFEQRWHYSLLSSRCPDCDLVSESAWRREVWYYVDDLCDSNSCHARRLSAARRLRELLGPWDYYRGVLP